MLAENSKTSWTGWRRRLPREAGAARKLGVVMMCYRYRKLLVPYSEGTLDERSARGLERHLERCASCAEELRVLRVVSGALRAVDQPAMEPAPDLWEKVSARIADQPAPSRRSILRVPQAVSAAAVVLLVAVVGFNLIRSDANLTTRDEADVPANVSATRSSAPSADKVKSAADNDADMAPSLEASTEARVFGQEVAGKPLAKQPKRPSGVVDGGSSGGAPRAAFDRAPRRAIAPPESTEATSAKAVAAAPEPPLESVRLYAEDSVGLMAAGRAFRSAPAPMSAAREVERVVAVPAAVAAEPADVEARGDTSYGTYVADSVADADTMGYGCVLGMSVTSARDADSPAVDVLNETEGIRTAALFSYP